MPLLRQRSISAAGSSIGLGKAAREGFAELLRTFREVRKFRPVILFLLAYWMYIDGVNTIMKMAVDYGLALGFPANSLITGILMIQFIGFPLTLLFGWLGDRISPLVGIFVAIAVYCAVTFYAVLMTSVTRVLHHGSGDRLRAGRDPGDEPLVLRPADPGRPRQRVLRLLQHDGQVCRGARVRS